MQLLVSSALRALGAVLALAPLVAGLSVLPHGQPRRYDLVLTWEKGAPDGYERDMFKVNGQFPGPTLEFNEDDDVEIFVQNKSPYETTVHYHGIEMLGTPWSDGVPGMTQIPIKPGCAFTYRWTATQHGTYFYHAHLQSQINDGLYGPIVIHPRAGTQKPYALITQDPKALLAIEKAEAQRIPLLIGDWRHMTSEAELEVAMQSHLEHTCFDSIIVNGKGHVDCLTPAQQQPLITPAQQQLLMGFNLTSKSCLPPQSLSAINDIVGTRKANVSVVPPDLFGECTPTTTADNVIAVTKKKNDTLCPGKWVVFDVIGALSLHTVMVSIDEIRAYVVAIDGNYIHPVTADTLHLTNGQRYTILAHFTTPKKYTLRVSSTLDPQILFGTAVIDYKSVGQAQSTEASVPSINERGVKTNANVIIYDGLQSVPYPPGANVPSPTVDATFKVTMGFGQSIAEYAFNSTPRFTQEDDSSTSAPLLLSPQPGRQDNHTITVPSSASWVDYVMQVTPGQAAHPIHIHGRHFYVLGSGQGAFPWDNVAQAVASGELPAGSINLVNPQLRDTYITPAAATGPTWLVLRRASDNEGVWLIHCHIQSHLQGGMSMVIQDGTDGGIAVPDEYRNYQCAAP